MNVVARTPESCGLGGATEKIREISGHLRRQGLRLTRPRMAIIWALCRAPGGLTHQRILREARIGWPDLGLATVYRTVELLEEQGCICRVHDAEGGEILALAMGGHGHHALCKKCSHVVEFSTCELQATIAGAARETGFVITGHRLELVGLCSRCAETEGRGTA